MKQVKRSGVVWLSILLWTPVALGGQEQGGATSTAPAPSLDELEHAGERRIREEADRFVEEGKRLFVEGNYEGARGRAGQALLLIPEHPQAFRLWELSQKFLDRVRYTELHRRPQSVEKQWERVEQWDGRVLTPAERQASHRRADPPSLRLPKGEPELPAWKEELSRKLQEPVDLRLDGMPAPEVLDLLRKRHSLPVVVDRKCRQLLEQETVSLQMERVPLESALNCIVRNEWGLDYALVDHMVLITGRERAEELNSDYRIYNVSEELAMLNIQDFPGNELDLAEGESIFGLVAPRKWDEMYLYERKKVTEKDLADWIERNVK
jgi:hypothetical protein